MYHSQKSQLLKRLDKTVTIPQFTKVIPSAIIIELSAVVQIKASCDAETFHEFSLIIYYYILELSTDFSRIDIVADQYFQDSLKEGTRKGRGSGTRKSFDDDTKFPMNMREDFLRNCANTEDLNRYLANKIMSLYSGSKTVVVTYDNIILSNDSALLLEDRRNNCTSEEADARLARHAIHCIEKGYNNIVVRTVDTDVLGLLICFRSYMNKLGCAKVYALMGKGMGLDYYDVEVCRCVHVQYYMWHKAYNLMASYS